MSQQLTFTTAHVLNTTVSNDTDTIYYDIQTPEWEPNSTTVRRLDRHTGRYELTGKILSEANKPTAVSLYGGEFELEGQWIKKVDGTKPGERCEYSRVHFDGFVAESSWESRVVVGGNSMTAKETCSHGA